MTKQHAKNLQDQLSSCGKLPMFEIEVTGHGREAKSLSLVTFQLMVVK
jgi:hypothetical protein